MPRGVAMNWTDYCIIGMLAMSVIMGLWRGFIGEVLALVCWVAAFWIAWLFGPRLGASFSAIDTPSVRLLLGYAISFVAVLIAGALVSFLMRKLISGSGLTGSDRLLGMIFGLIRGLALVTLLVFILGFTPFPRDAWWRQSQLLPTFEQGARWLSAQLPPNVTTHLDLREFLPQIPPAAAKGAKVPAPAPPENKPSS
jgi:membrane protein required for colicin V production